MGKIIFFAIIFLLLYWVIKNKFATNNKNKEPKETALLPDAAEEMVCCKHCGVHLPEEHSVAIDGNFFCSDDHHQKFLDSQP